LSDVVPTVLHHHEQWDGCGYPRQLEADEIPLLARITAVADAFDAMASDRPYRRGMPEEKVYEIFRKGAGQHWDAQVVETLFKLRDEVREISDTEREHPNLDVRQWSMPKLPASPPASQMA
jgi:HD-GYP domain-containing protein (c-di-GMP phosphodiesterase class II)